MKTFKPFFLQYFSDYPVFHGLDTYVCNDRVRLYKPTGLIQYTSLLIAFYSNRTCGKTEMSESAMKDVSSVCDIVTMNNTKRTNLKNSVESQI